MKSAQMSLRLSVQDHQALAQLASAYDLQTIDLVRMAVGSLIKSANENNGRITLPIRVINDR